MRFPIKKMAAGAALFVLAGYLLISGAAIPTQRAFVMNGLVFGAILVDRLRISMRICALAAAAVLLLDPASVVGVSFQMSFGAVVALIAVYESFGMRIGRAVRGGMPGGRVLRYCAGIAVTTIVATLGTLPFSIYHFHHLALYSTIANVLAVPLSAVWTLPWGVVACLLMPFGLERLALVPMGWGIDVTIWIAGHVSGLPGNVWPMPRLPIAGLLLISAGGLWLALWRQRWRRWGLVGIAAGLATLFLTRPPDIVLANGGHFLAVNGGAGSYYVRPERGEPIARSFLASETGATLLRWPEGEDAAGGLSCKDDLCTFAAHGRHVAILLGEDALPLDCAAFDAIVAQVKAGFHCRARMPVVDRIDSWRLGAVALWLDEDGVTLESANEARGARPWVPQRQRKGFTTAAGAFR
jgi:competence protein ComEC